MIVGLLLAPRQAVNTEHAVELEGGHQQRQNGRRQSDADGAQQRRSRQAARQRRSVDVQRRQRRPHRLGLQTLGGADCWREGGQVAQRQRQRPQHKIGLAGQMKREQAADRPHHDVDAQTQREVESHQSGPQSRFDDHTGQYLSKDTTARKETQNTNQYKI